MTKSKYIYFASVLCTTDALDVFSYRYNNYYYNDDIPKVNGSSSKRRSSPSYGQHSLVTP